MADFRYDLIPAGSRVLCALSGGADSMYLLCRLLEGGCEVRCAHYNHHLRDTAGRDEDFVRRWCGAHNIPLTVGHGDVAARAAQAGQGVEETARQMRYAFLEETAEREGCTLIATGHHSGDNAETVLMNLIRGSGLKGLCGIPERRGKLVRPMLNVSRADIEAYLAARGIPHVEDETNGDQSYTRNRVRRQLIPLLEELNPRAVEHICAAAARLKEDEAELSRQGRQLAALAEETAEGLSIPAAALARAPGPAALRALKELTGGAGALHLEQVLALCRGEHPSGQIDLPGCTARRVYDKLLLTGCGGQEAPPPIVLTDGEHCWGEWIITCETSLCPAKAYVSREEFYLQPDRYLVRSRREGDRLRLGDRPNKTLKKLMIDERVPRHLRHRVPVLATEAGAAAAGGFGPHREALAEAGTTCLHIIMRKGE